MKRKIAIVAGGDSSEHDVSLRSADGIMSFLDLDRYDAQIVELQGSDWQTLNRLREFDFCYITIHGTPGENGLLQGYLEMMHIPYSCCDVLAASLTFHKYQCNHYLENFGIQISPSILLRKGQARMDDEQIATQLGLPMFIKSNVGGSSFGCTKVKTLEDITPAIDFAFQEGDEVICEAFMKGMEINCGVYKTRTQQVALPITEIVPAGEYFDYDAKYNGNSQEITPARIPDEVRDQVQAMSLKIYDLIGARGIIRVDYIITQGWNIHLLEINTNPGMTTASLIPQQVRAVGRTMREVLSDVIEDILNP